MILPILMFISHTVNNSIKPIAPIPFFDIGQAISVSTPNPYREALVKYAQLLAAGGQQPGPTPTSNRYTEAQKEELLKMALTSERGKVALGQAMANPIRRSLPYQGIGRRALRAPAALPVYDVDVEVEAVVVSSQGARVI